MNKQPVLSFVINAHAPWFSHCPIDYGSADCYIANDLIHELYFFESISETYLPILEAFDRLDADRIPFRIGVSLSHALCYLISDEYLLQRYEDWAATRIEFGQQEIERTADSPELNRLARFYCDQAIERQILFTAKYERNLLNVFQRYQKKGNIELLATAATHAFLPFYTSCAEAVQAQIEMAIGTYRRFFGKYPQGFYLPELGYTPEVDKFLRAYNFGYTICDSHALVLGTPSAPRGTFFPVKTSSGVFVMARDFYATRDLVDGNTGFSQAGSCRDNCRDVGYELPLEKIKPFWSEFSRRMPTGYKYWSRTKNQLYDFERAKEDAGKQAAVFLDKRQARLEEASKYMEEVPLCLCDYNASSLGRLWYEGPAFLEALFREAARRGVQCLTPAEYLFDQDISRIETIVPEYSSSGANGYAETWLDSSNDWVHAQMIRAVERMTELAERFPNESGIKERALNQAAREILLSQDSAWANMLYRQEYSEYARRQIEDSLRNFTTIYESLGSGHISTEWLTKLERSHSIFPAINYRIFRRKR